MIPALSATAALGLLLSGCSASAPVSPAELAATEQTELRFSLDQCERQADSNLFKCPAVDKPICNNPEYNGQLACVQVGPDGSIFVQRAID
jgi:hypothetical protein